MPALPLEFWFVIAAITACAVLGSLRALSALLNYEVNLQDVTAEGERLRREYDRRMKEMLKDSEVLDEGEASLPIAQEAMEHAQHLEAA